MKTTHKTNWIRIAVLCLALTLVLILLTLPLLATAISQIVGDPIEPAKLDIRPIPVPVPPPPVAMNQPSASMILVSLALALGPVPQPISVPTSPPSATPTVPLLAERQTPEPSVAATIPVANQQGFLAMTLICILLLSFVWLHRLPGLHSLTKENPC